ncbi:uncharacterized protein PFLUO_LOCUS6363 [Penicillium psychrofluorescens]|uniref:uncharacterized protein n=1 Tax=Penicillium psychrofluorescens TaxID=3158075 RepID=UPI003CCD3C48
MVTDAVKSVNLDFDARVPIPFSVFPSSYRSDAVSETTQTRVEGEVNLEATSRVEREDTRGSSAQLPNPRFYGKEEVDLRVQQDDRRAPRNYSAEVELTRERYPNYQQPSARYEDRPPVYDQTVETQLDLTERDYRRRTSPTYDYDVSYDRHYQPAESYGYQQQQQPVSTDIRVTETVRDSAAPASNKMGYYDDEGHYHSFRRGVERAADRIMHPFHHSDREEVVVNEQAGPARFSESAREDVRIVEPRNRGSVGETVPIPCHFIRIGDILILQGRPCQVIRISVSPQTGQHRYLGVDLFTRQLQEESSFVSNPSPSVVVQTMLGPVYKTYRILDLREDGRLVAMTETGDVKQGLPVIPQGSLFKRIRDAFADGRGSVRALVINDGGRELVVDFKVIHGSRL